MSISIVHGDVKRKTMISDTDTTYDTSIDALIAELQPAVEQEIRLDYLNAVADTRLQAVLKLGILEIISGEFLEQLMREAGKTESFTATGYALGVPIRLGPDLINQGRQRLAPYLESKSADLSASSSASDALEFDYEDCPW